MIPTRTDRILDLAQLVGGAIETEGERVRTMAIFAANVMAEMGAETSGTLQ